MNFGGAKITKRCQSLLGIVNDRSTAMKHIPGLTLILLFIMSYSDAQINHEAKIQHFLFEQNGNFPNNSELPVLLYRNIFEFESGDPAKFIEDVLGANNWGSGWRNGIYNFHHYHSTAHEALGVYSGWAEVQLGGEGSDIVRIEKGDLVVLPAGTAHKRIDSGDGFAVVGVYPDGQNWDMNYGKAKEVQAAKENIPGVALPSKDPVFGENGKIFQHWK